MTQSGAALARDAARFGRAGEAIPPRPYLPGHPTAQETLICASPDHDPDSWADAREWPLNAWDYIDLLAQARIGLARRQETYPGLIAAGKLTQAAADADIAGWQLLVHEWNWINTGQGKPPSVDSLPARIDAVNLALDRVAAQLKRGPTTELIRQSHLLQAMHWHLHRTAKRTRQIRAAMAARKDQPA